MMTHLDDESLALLALGDASPDATQQKHLLACSRCEEEVASLARLVSVGRTSRDVEIVQPPARVWNRIHAELGLSGELADIPLAGSPPRPALESPDATTADGTTTTASDGDARVTTLRPTRRPATRWWMVAAALLLGVVAGVVGSSFLSPSDASRVVAEAVLEPFPTWTASGSARVEKDPTGNREVVVDLSAPGRGLREVWLIDPDTSGLVSLGLLSGTSGTFSIPADLDLSRYSVVDVSEEPDDGNPAHSGNSIVRGSLSSV